MEPVEASRFLTEQSHRKSHTEHLAMEPDKG